MSSTLQKADGKTVAPKIAYSEEFEPWGWVITTGNYVDNLEKNIEKNRVTLQNRQKEHDDAEYLYQCSHYGNIPDRLL